MIHKAFVILESFSSKKENMTIKDISDMTSIPRSTVHRILQSLAEEGVVTMVPQRGYCMTPKLISLGLKGIAQKDLLDVAVPIMRDISEKTQETVSLNVICGHERVCIYRVEGNHPITRNIKIGDKGPLFKGSAGQIIAAGLNQSQMREMLNKYIQMDRIKEDEVDDILQKLEDVREQGYALSVGERIENSASIGVPIKDITGYTQAALSVSTLADRLNEGNKQRFLKLLTNAVGEINAFQGNML